MNVSFTELKERKGIYGARNTKNKYILMDIALTLDVENLCDRIKGASSDFEI